MSRLARSLLIVIAITVVAVYFVGNLRLEFPQKQKVEPPDWGIQTYSPPQWDADICAKGSSNGKTCVIGRPENVAMLCTETSAARTWPHVQLRLVIPNKLKLLADLEDRRLRRLANASSNPSSSGSGSSSSSSGAGSGSSSSSSGASIPERFGTFFDMIVESDLRSFGNKEDTYHFLHALFLDNMYYGYASGDWSFDAFKRRGFQAGDEIVVSIPLAPRARKFLENLRLGKDTSGDTLHQVAPMLIKLDEARKIRDEITGCLDFDRSIGNLDFDETDLRGAWARSSSPVVEQELKPIACGAGRNSIFVADNAGQTFLWLRPRKRLGSFPSYGFITDKKVRIEPPYVFVKSGNTETKSIAVKVSKNMIVLKEVMSSANWEPNSLILLQRCEPSLDVASFDRMRNRLRL